MEGESRGVTEGPFVGSAGSTCTYLLLRPYQCIGKVLRSREQLYEGSSVLRSAILSNCEAQA